MRRSSRYLAGWALGLLSALGQPGCRCHGPRVEEQKVTVPDEMEVPPGPVPLGSWRIPAAGRVVAVGDLHGDVDAARRALRLAGAIDESDRWIGAGLVVVQMGDFLDRGPSEKELLALMDRLKGEAKAAGGGFWPILGNHEFMNVAGDLRYVSTAGFLAFSQDAGASQSDPRQALRERAEFFSPGAPIARQLSEYPVVLVAGDTVFVHGSVLPRHLRYGLIRINQEASAWMKGEGDLSEELRRMDSPVWARHFAESVSESDCQVLKRELVSLAVHRMVVGHTPQKHGITMACDGLVARVDVNLSSFYGSNPVQILQIDQGKVTILIEAASPTNTSLP